MSSLPPGHRIETLQWELSFADARLASAQQDRLARLLRARLLVRLERGFERHAPRGQVWRIDTLEIDLGRLGTGDSASQWELRLDAALDRALTLQRQQARTDGNLRQSATRHELDRFLHYLQHGHLPWGAPPRAGRELSSWLARLAHQQGRRLWDALQLLMPPGTALARLSRIAPHQGLQALLAVRDETTAEALLQLDTLWLAPLQQQGRLSAYQLQQLQQAMRAAALASLWGLSGGVPGPARRRRFVEQLLAAHARVLGPGWTGLRQAFASSSASQAALRLQRDGGSALAGQLLEALLGSPAGVRASDPMQAASDAAPTRTWDAALALLRRGLQRDKASPAERARLAQLLRSLAASRPAALREHLQRWLRERRSRRRWSELLEPQTLWTVLSVLDGQGLPATAAGTALPSQQPHWADSLRQTALRLLSSCPAAQRPGLSQLQALLMEASLAHLAAGQRLPSNHRAWQALWQRAWDGWLGERAAPAQPPRPQPAAEPPASPLPPGSLPPALLDRELARLRRDCEQQRWQLGQRLQLARLLETPRACERWLALLDENSRWRMLRAQFGRAVDALRRRAHRLGRLLGLGRGKAEGGALPWRALLRQLFVEGLGTDPARLRPLLAAEPPGDAPADPPAQRPAAAAAREGAPLWVGDAGQVLLAAFAERLFRQLGLLHENRFVDERARARALLCLQALVLGREPSSEPQWVLSKLLCGLAPDALLAVDAEPLDEATHELLEGLLGAVIAHWKALGNTSVAGLRESFLQREGRLTLRAGTADDATPQWQLQVQPRAFDMLLDRLPWSFGTIRLPWMTGVLHVDWR
jgi:hypothetical protein